MKIVGKFGQWWSEAKGKYEGELANPDSKLSKMKTQILKLNEEIKNS